MINKPGVYIMPEAEYHADPCPVPSLSSSLCKTLLYRSPLHAWMEHPRLNPAFQAVEESKFDRGTVAHAMFLQGRDIVHVVQADDWRTNAAKAEREKARAGGLVPILDHQYGEILAMVSAAKLAWAANEDLAGIPFLDGKVEQTLAWREGQTWLRARPDWMANDRKLIVDYKTTAASAAPEDWVRTMLGCGFDIQAPFYLRGNRATGGPEDTKFVFLVQECEPPYACSWIGLPPGFIALGDEKVESAIATWRRCVAADKWPGYPTRICWAEVPAWAEARWTERAGIPYDLDKLFGPKEKAA